MINRPKPWNGTDGVRNIMQARHRRMSANYRSGNAGLKGEMIKLLLKAQKIKTKIKMEETRPLGNKKPPDGNIPSPLRCRIQDLQ